MKMAGLDAIRRKTADESARKSVLNFIPVVVGISPYKKEGVLKPSLA